MHWRNNLLKWPGERTRMLLSFAGRVVQIGRREKSFVRWRNGEGKLLAQIAAGACAYNFFPNLFAYCLPAERISRLTFKADEEEAGQKGIKRVERGKEPIRALTSTIKFLETYWNRNYRSIRSERFDGESCEDRAARDPVPFKISTLYSCRVLSRSLMISLTHEWHPPWSGGREEGGGITFRLSLYAAFSRSSYQFALSPMNFYGFFAFLSILSSDLLYPVSLSALTCICRFMSSSFFCPKKEHSLLIILIVSI